MNAPPHKRSLSYQISPGKITPGIIIDSEPPRLNILKWNRPNLHKSTCGRKSPSRSNSKREDRRGNQSLRTARKNSPGIAITAISDPRSTILPFSPQRSDIVRDKTLPIPCRQKSLPQCAPSRSRSFARQQNIILVHCLYQRSRSRMSCLSECALRR